jgi:FkbM family methyltransferase
LEKKFGNFKSALLFEPELLPYVESLHKYKSRDSIISYNLALGSGFGKINYRGEGSFNLKSGFNVEAQSVVQIVPLDFMSCENMTFLKVDVEGAEAEVLHGARKTIRKFRPTLAICCYHRGDDIWRLIFQVAQISSSYRVGIRHYSDILDDTTLYFY